MNNNLICTYAEIQFRTKNYEMLVKVGNTADKETRKKGRFREGLPIDNLFFLFFTFLFS